MKKIISVLMLTALISFGTYSHTAQTSSDMTETVSVIPGGETVGIKLYTEGLLVIGLSDGASPARKCGIEKGDIILSADEIRLTDAAQLCAIASERSSIELEIMRDGKTHTVTLEPQMQSGAKRIGVWVRDSTAGLGTVTFYTDNSFAALGHGVTDCDTGNVMPLSSGSITGARVAGITKGKRGSPGELVGSFKSENLGDIKLNSDNGIYGMCTPPQKERIPIAPRNEVCEGDACILADIDGNGAKAYGVKIERAAYYAKTKSLIIHVTDEVLIEKTGGIVQGMSGAPILQNGKLVGAVTHVFVNDPERGYGIFAETMYNCTRNLEGAI